MNLNEEFWNNRYLSNDIGWDLGTISTPLKTYVDQLKDKSLKILIPGAGNAYEAEYLHKKDFKNVYLADVSETALTNLSKRVPSFPKSHLIHGNFFDLKMTFDLVIEQTFFCAINPNLRTQYVLKMNSLLNAKGKIVGLLFNVPLHKDHPPFGGCKEEYIDYFRRDFYIDIMETAYNSIPERADKELFIKLRKK